MGWETNIRNITDEPVVCCISHTSKWEILLYFLYRYNEKLRNIKIVMKPQPFKSYGWILKKFGFIPSTRREDTRNGFVENTIEMLKDEKIKHIVISPEGTLSATPWRSGYFYIAKGINYPIGVAGFDFEKKKLIVSKEKFIHENIITTEPRIKSAMGKIVPLYEEKSFVTIRKHKKENVGLISKNIYYYGIPILILITKYCLD